MPAPMSITARHLANLAPSLRYSASRSRRPSSPSVITSPGQNGSGFVPLSTLMPGSAPACSISLTSGVPSLAFWRIVSSIEDDAGDVLRHRLAGAEHQLAIVAAVVLGVLDADRVEALLDRARGLVGRQDARARRDHGLGDLVEFSEVHRNPSLSLSSCFVGDYHQIRIRSTLSAALMHAAPRRRAACALPAIPGTRRRRSTHR